MRALAIAITALGFASSADAQSRFTSFNDAANWLESRVPTKAGWVLASVSDRRLMSVKYDSIKVGEYPTIQIWIRDDLTEPTDFAGTPYQSMKTLVSIECYQDRYRTLVSIFHPQLGGEGIPVFSNDVPTDWSHLIPDTTLKGATDWACDYAGRLLDDPAGTLINPLGSE